MLQKRTLIIRTLVLNLASMPLESIVALGSRRARNLMHSINRRGKHRATNEFAMMLKSTAMTRIGKDASIVSSLLFATGGHRWGESRQIRGPHPPGQYS
jgi:hypothetical protein